MRISNSWTVETHYTEPHVAITYNDVKKELTIYIDGTRFVTIPYERRTTKTKD
jgi:hypothetical protein